METTETDAPTGFCDMCQRDDVTLSGAADRYDESLAFCVECCAQETQ